MSKAAFAASLDGCATFPAALLASEGFVNALFGTGAVSAGTEGASAPGVGVPGVTAGVPYATGEAGTDSGELLTALWVGRD